MSRLYNSAFDQDENGGDVALDEQKDLSEYPKSLRVDGYDVSHYYSGDVPVYEIKDANGDILGVAYSTSEMHEYTQGVRKND